MAPRSRSDLAPTRSNRVNEISGPSKFRGETIRGGDNSVSVHHYCFPCIKSVSWIHGKTSKTDRR